MGTRVKVNDSYVRSNLFVGPFQGGHNVEAGSEGLEISRFGNGKPIQFGDAPEIVKDATSLAIYADGSVIRFGDYSAVEWWKGKTNDVLFANGIPVTYADGTEVTYAPK